MKNLKILSALLIIQRRQGAQRRHQDFKEEKTCLKATGDVIAEKRFKNNLRRKIYVIEYSLNIRAIGD